MIFHPSTGLITVALELRPWARLQAGRPSPNAARSSPRSCTLCPGAHSGSAARRILERRPRTRRLALVSPHLEQTQLLLWLASIEEHVRRGSFCEHPQPPELRQIPQPPLLPPRFQDG